MPENIPKAAFPALLLCLTGLFAYPLPAEAASVINLTGAPQTVNVSPGRGDFKPVTIPDGKAFNTPSDLIVHYHNFNVRMRSNQQLTLLKNGGFRLENEHKKGSDDKNKNNKKKKDNNDKDEGISI